MQSTYPVVLASAHLVEQRPGRKHCRLVCEYAISTARHRHKLHLAMPLRDYLRAGQRQSLKGGEGFCLPTFRLHSISAFCLSSQAKCVVRVFQMADPSSHVVYENT